MPRSFSRRLIEGTRFMKTLESVLVIWLPPAAENPAPPRQSRLARLVARHIRQRVVGLPHLGRMLRHPLAEALADHRCAAMDTNHSALTRQQFQHLVGH